jgi:regulatory protein
VSPSAYQKALKLLGRRDHFRRELYEKLSARGFEPDEIADAIERCAELGLVDDLRVGTRFVEVRAVDRGWGPRRLAAELRHRGVGAIDAEVLSVLPEDVVARSLATALRKVEVRAPEKWWRDSQRRARMVSSLITRGFETDDAMAAVSGLAASREIQDHAPDDQ